MRFEEEAPEEKVNGFEGEMRKVDARLGQNA